MEGKNICYWYEKRDLVENYARMRPKPPQELCDKIIAFLREKYTGDLTEAIDVGCGSGQGTNFLASHFCKVTGVDTSAAQIEVAVSNNKHNNVIYRVAAAESLPVGDSTQQLVTSFVAAHFFDLPKFFAEVDRVLVPGGVVALVGYFSFEFVHEDKAEQLNKEIYGEIQDTFKEFYNLPCFQILSTRYQTIELPYEETQRIDNVYVQCSGTLAEYFGLRRSMSHCCEYAKKYGARATEEVFKSLETKALKILGSTTSAETTPIAWRVPFFTIMARKPQQ